MNRMLKDKKIIFLLVFPGFFVFAFSVLFPIILSVYYGTTDWSGIGSYNFIGFKNFVQVIQDKIFWHSLRNAAILALVTIVIQHPFCMFFAILLDRMGGKTEKIFRTILFIPCIISIMVTSKMWVSIYDPQYGLLNKVLDFLHLGFLKQQWLGDPQIVLYSVILIIIWQGFGWGMIIYYAGIKGIPGDVYEAARIDGANTFQTFIKITLPLLQPVILVNITLAVISSLKQMETIYLTTNGGPGHVSQFLANYLYIKAFSSYEYGYGNAISVLFVIICLTVTIVLNKVLKKESYEF